jgi:hypothetical protein
VNEGGLQVVFAGLGSFIPECRTQESDVGLLMVNNLLVTTTGERGEPGVCECLVVEFGKAFLVEGVFEVFEGECEVEDGVI